MKNILRLEECAMLCFSIYGFNLLNFSWWWLPLLLLTPDIGIAGYLINNKIGALTYNIFHNKTLAVLFLAVGIYSGHQLLLLIGIIMFAHASMDRMLGYGLKYSNSFFNTHLGIIPKFKM
jgi:hypothetical protein